MINLYVHDTLQALIIKTGQIVDKFNILEETKFQISCSVELSMKSITTEVSGFLKMFI